MNACCGQQAAPPQIVHGVSHRYQSNKKACLRTDTIRDQSRRTARTYTGTIACQYDHTDKHTSTCWVATATCRVLDTAQGEKEGVLSQPVQKCRVILGCKKHHSNRAGSYRHQRTLTEHSSVKSRLSIPNSFLRAEKPLTSLSEGNIWADELFCLLSSCLAALDGACPSLLDPLLGGLPPCRGTP